MDEIITGMATHGVVGVIRAGSSDRAIGLRADMDALPIHEETGLPHASRNPGVMHACGHDGHTTMLLGAAKYLAETRNFDGTVYLIFQPAEEFEGGADKMVKDGLFDRCPMEKVYGLHNWPETKAGTFLWRTGPVMAAVGFFDIVMTGRGSHGAVAASGHRSDRGLGADHRRAADDRFPLDRADRGRRGFGRQHLRRRGLQHPARAGGDEGHRPLVPARGRRPDRDRAAPPGQWHRRELRRHRRNAVSTATPGDNQRCRGDRCCAVDAANIGRGHRWREGDARRRQWAAKISPTC